jgi:hypothetical protein
MFDFLNERNKTGSKLRIGDVSKCAFAKGGRVIVFDREDFII